MPTIVILDYNPAWPAAFEHLRAHIWPSIHEFATTIEHVGSTSVPGLAAKPIIDMTIIVPFAGNMPPVIERLATLGYQHRGDLGVPGREAFACTQPAPIHHLYACIAGNDALRNHLTLRDHLRRTPSAVQAYADLKKQLAQRFPNDIDAYIEGKTNFILTILSHAGFSPTQLNAIRALNAKPKATG